MWEGVRDVLSNKVTFKDRVEGNVEAMHLHIPEIRGQ